MCSKESARSFLKSQFKHIFCFNDFSTPNRCWHCGISSAKYVQSCFATVTFKLFISSASSDEEEEDDEDKLISVSSTNAVCVLLSSFDLIFSLLLDKSSFFAVLTPGFWSFKLTTLTLSSSLMLKSLVLEVLESDSFK